MRKAIMMSLTLCALAAVAQAQTQPMGATTDHTHMDHAAHMAMMADAQRQAEVARRGKDVMPFELAATTHIFTQDAEGGVQRVVAKRSSETAQVELVRQHLKDIREQFLRGDFSGPSHIHGTDMPGLAALQAARPGQIDISYREVPDGAELIYRTREPALVSALHQWFDAQVSDHGKDAMAGHSHADMMEKQKPPTR